MQVRNRQALIFYLAAALAALSGGSAQNLDNSNTFKVSKDVISCPIVYVTAANTSSHSACAMLCSVSDACRLFSFINGSCTMSESAICFNSAHSQPWIKVGGSLGYIWMIGARCFWVFQQRRSGAVSFVRLWTEYEQGFGDEVNFWGGLRTLNSLTSRGNATLRIEMTTQAGALYASEWSNFTVADASTKYTLQYNQFLPVSNLSSDPMLQSRGYAFSTYDQDNDLQASFSCSKTYHGYSGFWYSGCAQISPNAYYATTNKASANYMSCNPVVSANAWTTLSQIRMMLELN